MSDSIFLGSPQFTALQTRVSQPDLVNLSEPEIEAILDQPAEGNGTIGQDVDPLDIFDILINSGSWGRIEQWSRPIPNGSVSNPSNQDQLVARCINVVRAVDMGRPLRTSRDAVRAQWGTIFSGLQTDGFITAAIRTQITALATRNRSWAEANGFVPPNYPEGVTTRHIGLVRGAG